MMIVKFNSRHVIKPTNYVVAPVVLDLIGILDPVIAGSLLLASSRHIQPSVNEDASMWA